MNVTGRLLRQSPEWRTLHDGYPPHAEDLDLPDSGRTLPLDEEAARTGRSISALVGDAVKIVDGVKRSTEADLAIMRKAFGAWKDRESDGESWVESLCSGSRSAQ